MAIVVRFIADATNFLKGVEESISATNLFSKKSTAEFAKVTKAVGAWSAATASAMAAAGAAMVKSSAESAKQLQNLSQVANASTTEFQKYAYAAAQVGIEQDKFSDIVKDVNDRIGDFVATGAGPMVDFFEQIAPKVGVTAEQFRKLSGPQALQLYYDSLQKANLSQQDMTFFLEAMASDTTALIPLLRDGGKGFAEAADEADRLGLVMSEIDVQRMAQLDTRMKALGASVEAAKNQFAAGFMPAVEGSVNAVLDLAGETGNFKDVGTTAMNAMVSAIGFVMDAVQGARVAFKGLSILGPSIGAAFVTAFELVMKSNANMVDFIIKGANMAIAAINKISPVAIEPINFRASESAAVQFVTKLGDTTRGVVVQMQDELKEMAMQRLPSDTLRQYVDEAIAEGERLAQETGTQKTGGGTGLKTTDEEKDAIEKERERQRTRIEVLRQAMTSEEEIRAAKFAREMEELALHNENKIFQEGEYEALVKAKNEQFMADIADIRERGMTEQERIMSMSMAAQSAMVIGELGNMFAAFGTHSKKMNKAAQIFGATSAFISTLQGQAEALKLPFPANLAAAAKVGAVGMGFVSAIKSAGSGGSSSGGGTASAGTAVAATPPPNTFNVNISGMNPDQMFSGRQFGDIIGVINERLRAGDRLEGISA